MSTKEKLTEAKIKQLKKMPLIQTRVRRLKDSNLIVHQTVISDIRPIEYYEAVVDKKNKNFVTELEKLMQEMGV